MFWFKWFSKIKYFFSLSHLCHLIHICTLFGSSLSAGVWHVSLVTSAPWPRPVVPGQQGRHQTPHGCQAPETCGCFRQLSEDQWEEVLWVVAFLSVFFRCNMKMRGVIYPLLTNYYVVELSGFNLVIFNLECGTGPNVGIQQISLTTQC